MCPASRALPAKPNCRTSSRNATICVCVLPLTEDTNGIMNAEFFAQLPKGAFVINVARGGHLIEEDLIAALDSGHLAGAVLDVFQTEPLPDGQPDLDAIPRSPPRRISPASPMPRRRSPMSPIA